MTTYIAAYDTENPECLQGVRRIVKAHEKYEMPATFFIVARLLEEQGAEYRQLIGGNPLFEIASHSFTHMLLRPHRVCGDAGPREQHWREVVESKKRIEDCFEQKVTGFRTPFGFSDGLRGAPHLLELCREAGYRYSSSLLWGPKLSLPALLRNAFSYSAEGHPDLWEIPGNGWHENLLKEKTDPMPLQLFPHPMPEASLTRGVDTPQEEFSLYKVFIDKAMESDTGHVSLIWHPWSLDRFDPDMNMLELVFDYVRNLGLPVATFEQQAKMLSDHLTGTPDLSSPAVDTRDISVQA